MSNQPFRDDDADGGREHEELPEELSPFGSDDTDELAEERDLDDLELDDAVGLPVPSRDDSGDVMDDVFSVESIYAELRGRAPETQMAPRLDAMRLAMDLSLIHISEPTRPY